MKTAVVILNWNTREFLKKFLPGLLKSVQDIDGSEVIVADNASEDGSLELMKEEFPTVRTIAFERNYGFTGGYDKALAQIDAEYYVLINSDIEVSEGWLEPLVRWMDNNPDCGACAPKLLDWKDKSRFEYAGAAGGYIDRFGYPFCRGRVMGRVEKDNGQYDDSCRDVFWASGACLMVRSSLFHKSGGLDERFFAHMEEIDLCWRMQLAGYRVCIVPESSVAHVGGGTLPSGSPFKLFLNYRNNLLMLDNNLAKTYALRRHKQGYDETKASEMGISEAGRTIFIRMMMDWLSAFIYLITLRFKNFNAVVKAHREYRKMKASASVGDIAAYLSRNHDSQVRGIYGKWIVAKSMLDGDKVFSRIYDKDFFKF